MPRRKKSNGDLIGSFLKVVAIGTIAVSIKTEINARIVQKFIIADDPLKECWE